MTVPNENRRYCKAVLRILALLLFPYIALAQPGNNSCSNATQLISYQGSSCTFPTAGTLTGATNTASEINLGTCASSSVDVWYRFVAKSTNPTVRVTQTSGTAGQLRYQVLTGSCGAFTASSACNNATATLSSLTLGQTYYIRVYTSGSAFNFNICVTDPNDVCSGVVTLTSSTSCTNVPGNMYGATNTAITVNAPNCAPTVSYDVWYRFVAQTSNPTITLSSLGSEFTNPGMQLLSNCSGTVNQLFCGTTSITASHLTPGTTYFIRVYSTGTAPTNPANADFNICITDPVSSLPSNDECINAVNLSVSNGCNTISGDMAAATPSSTPLGGSCTGPNAYDVWYKFRAVNSIATVTLGSVGANFLNPRIEILSGTCGSFTTLFCGTSSLAATGLTAGTTYYVRVYSTTAPAPNGNARFNICITSSSLPTVRFGNSYVNVSKRSTGGVVQPGDTLEIRMTIHHTSGTFSGLRFVDNIPTNTALLTGPADYIRIITNEGLTYKQYTRAAGDDAATYVASPPAGQYNIRMNLGFGGTNPGIPVDNTATEFASATGSMTNSNNPRGGGGLLFAVANRVVVTGSVGSTIQLNPAQFIYRSGTSDVTLTATPNNIYISNPLTLCSNSIGLNNASEFGGTFGSGTSLNRSTDLTIPISGYSFVNNVSVFNSVGDGRYAIVKNISPKSSTNRNANRIPSCGSLAFDDAQNCNNRMYSHWFIDGDHSGTNNATGNTPPAEATNSGYMLMVNADFVASEVYSQTINNLCPNTYYEFSAWFRNICATCGADSTGSQFTGTATAPASGYPGVYPNLSFALNGLDYYSTGEIDTVGWVKKGFVFRTGPSQTSATFSIRNNSQGGGGNDWAMDDIAVATCLPTMSYSPTINPFVCEYNPIQIADTISSYFTNYTTFKWQRSTNAGATWTDITGVTTLPDTNYYITTYTIPPAYTTMANNGDLYRVVVATNATNLSNPNCNISDGVTITLHVNSCEWVLDVNLLSFNGRLVNSQAQLAWTTSQETMPVSFIIERSTDGRNFYQVGTLAGHNNGSATNRYTFADSRTINGMAWYRIVMVTQSGKKKYSSVIQLKDKTTEFDVTNVINPFSNTLTFNVTLPANGPVALELLDMSGKKLISTETFAYAGVNSMSLETPSLPSGVYTLRVANKGSFIIKRVMKN